MFLHTLFLKLLNMSLTASAVIVCVLFLRLFLKKAPKIISYALWSIVLFRLLCPISIESGLSLFGLLDTPTVENGTRTSRIEYLPSDMVLTEDSNTALTVPGFGAPTDSIDLNASSQSEAQSGANVSGTFLPGTNSASTNLPDTPLSSSVPSNTGLSDTFKPNAGFPDTIPANTAALKHLLSLAPHIWLIGILAMGLYTAISYIRLRRKLLTASPLQGNIYLADEITSPFVMGLFRPNIYLPSHIKEQEQAYILMHEQHHIRRCDHILKALGFGALCLHWFNPLVWIAFILAGKDMEMSCDEAVVKKMGACVLADYTASLLSLATGKRIIAGMPLAFGEGDTKGRIHNLILRKKQTFWVILAAVACCTVLAVGLLTNPRINPQKTDNNENTTMTDSGQTNEYSGTNASSSQSNNSGSNDSSSQPNDSGTNTSSSQPNNSGTNDSSAVQRWFDYYGTNEINWDSPKEISPDAFPGVTFRWTDKTVEAIAGDTVTTLYTGAPIWNVFFTDLTGDGFPELCSCISPDSDIHNDCIIVYDYVTSKRYSLRDAAPHCYTLSMQGEWLIATKFNADYGNKSYYPRFIDTGQLELIDGTLHMIKPQAKTNPFYDLEQNLSHVIPLYYDNRNPDKPEDIIHAEAHIMLDSKWSNPAPSFIDYDICNQEVTAYLLVLHTTYRLINGNPERESSSYVPTICTFTTSDSGGWFWNGDNYWEPQNSNNYRSEVQEKFPAAAAETILKYGQDFIEDLEEQCYQKALETLNRTTE